MKKIKLNYFIIILIALAVIGCVIKEEKIKSDFFEALESISYKQKRKFEDFIKTAYAQEGYPDVFKTYVDEIDYEFLNYYSLDTKNDSIKVFAGTLLDRNKIKNWFCMAVNDSIDDYQIYSYNKDRHKIYGNNIGNDFSSDILFKTKNQSHKAGLKITFLDTINEILKYSWRDGFEPKDSLTLVKFTKPLSLGDKVPELKLTNLKGIKINFFDKTKKATVIFWCDFNTDLCLEQIPYLNKLKEKYKNQKINFLMITDAKIDEVNTYLGSNIFLYDIAFLNEKSTKIFGFGKPKHFVVNGKKKIVFQRDGVCYSCKTVLDEIDGELTKLVGEDNNSTN